MAKSNKIQKKSFFEVNTGATGAKIALYAATIQELDGKIVRLDLTRSLRGKSLELRLRVKAEGEKLTAEPIALELAGSYTRRMMRKGSDYVEDSFVAECKDSKVIVKPFMITRHKVSRAVRRSLRNLAREHVLVYFKARSSKEVFTDITTNKIQKELSLKLKKVYPLALCEIRVLEILPADSELKVAVVSESNKKESETKVEPAEVQSTESKDSKKEPKKSKNADKDEKN